MLRNNLPADNLFSLQETVTFGEDDLREVERLLNDLSEALESLPVVLSQHGEMVCAAQATGEEAAAHMIRLADRMWHEGTTGPAREVIRFNEEPIGEGATRKNMMLYSAHVAGGLVLSVGWRLTISLTQLRAEVVDTRQELRRLLGL